MLGLNTLEMLDLSELHVWSGRTLWIKKSANGFVYGPRPIRCRCHQLHTNRIIHSFSMDLDVWSVSSLNVFKRLHVVKTAVRHVFQNSTPHALIVLLIAVKCVGRKE